MQHEVNKSKRYGMSSERRRTLSRNTSIFLSALASPRSGGSNGSGQRAGLSNSHFIFPTCVSTGGELPGPMSGAVELKKNSPG